MALLSELPDERANEGAWSELEHRFFAAAPPDVPEPPPEPMRFDDLDPVEPLPPSPWRAQLSRTWRATAPARRRLHAAGRDAYRRAAPAVVRAWRRSILLSVVARKWSATALRRSAPALAALRIGARNHRLIAAGAAALVVVMGISAVVVASRGGGRAEQAAQRAARPRRGVRDDRGGGAASRARADPDVRGGTGDGRSVGRDRARCGAARTTQAEARQAPRAPRPARGREAGQSVAEALKRAGCQPVAD